MKIDEISCGKGITLSVMQTAKFKRSFLQLSFVLPREEREVAVAAVTAATVIRGCEKYKTNTALNRALCALYDAGVSVHTQPFGETLFFNVSATILDDRYAFDGGDVFGGVLEIISQLLFHPLASDGALDASYVESEKKRRIDMIRAEIDNKDKYALIQAEKLAFKGTPLAIRCTEETVGAVTPAEAFELLERILATCPVRIMFAGDMTETKKRSLDAFIACLAERREEVGNAENTPLSLPLRETSEEVIETVAAKQGRMALIYSLESFGRGDAAPMVFDEIFGASPVSRLFMNVRERLSLCYYCSSRASRATGRMTVRSGLDLGNRDKAMAEIEYQLRSLTDPENITDEELENAKLSRISLYTAMEDEPESYMEWYRTSSLAGLEESTDELIGAIRAVTKDDIARVARSVKLQLSYFLNGVGGE